ncbi:hypothetical protein [Hymenobacter sp. BT730]|uniref:hypothetical protein n=1 Tax=Hymenobacter sp. BT730 TaxID=3063332 RepID=UPI0026DF7E96|nr:hypothetical protein [Hymenobacter sp. BT730]
MKPSLYFLPIYSALLVLSGCSKDDVSPAEQARKNLIDKNYIRTALTVTPEVPREDGKLITDLFNDLAFYKMECVRDDIDRYSSNGDFIHGNGETKCDSSEIQSYTSKWRFLDDYHKIELNGGRKRDTLYIIINDGKVLQYNKVERYAFGGTLRKYTFTETWLVTK